MSNLVERLREEADLLDASHCNVDATHMRTAANEIERLDAQLNATREERGKWIANYITATAERDAAVAARDALLKNARDAALPALARADRAEAERDRMREALLAAEKAMRRVQDWGNARDTELADLAYEKVRAALGEAGFSVKAPAAVPDGEVRFVQGGRIVGRIIGLKEPGHD